MTKKGFFSVAILAVAMLFTACGGSSRMTKSTSTRVDLAKSVRLIPSVANLSVNPTRVEATMTATELESLNNEQMKQAVVAKALAPLKADILIAPEFSTTKGEDGKLAVLGSEAGIIGAAMLS